MADHSRCDAIIAITYKCGTACKTCNTWMLEGTMPFDRFTVMWDKLQASEQIERFVVNGLGDVNVLPDAVRYLKYMESHRRKEGQKFAQEIVFTTNGKVLPYIPEVEHYIISFNGGNKETYEYTTGLPFEKTRDVIREKYDDLKKKVGCAEIHMVVWSGNKGSEDDFKRLWADFPGRVRLNYRATNIPAKHAALEELPPSKEPQVYCDNLDVITVQPNGDIELCFCGFSTDFTGLKSSPVFGNIFEDSIPALLNAPERIWYKAQMARGIFEHPCDKCNYNVSLDNKLVYLKG
jgi:hypothetical protein